MFSIKFTLKVKKDLNNINDFISLDNPFNAVKTINSIFKSIYYLEEFPYLGKEIDDNLRELVEPNYKYKIIYKIEKLDVVILGVYKYKKSWD